MYSLDDYNYDLPAELIAQQPAKQRDQSRLLCLDRQTGRLTHAVFNRIGDFIGPGDVLVVNNTAVIPGRLDGRKETGGKVEVLISDFVGGRKSTEEAGTFVCRCLVKASKRSSPGSRFHFAEGLKAEVLDVDNGYYRLKFHAEENFESLLNRIGQVPLPPYIKRNSGKMPGVEDRLSYQTVYASQKGAIAAPTAGLHFTENLLNDLRKAGVNIVELTLHVGYGTFAPVRATDIRQHQMHAEDFTIPTRAAAAINTARARGHRVVAVGTTSVRTLEFAATPDGEVQSGSGSCDLFIYPGYRFNVVEAMITNFHLPQSTLLMLVSAFAGRQNVLNAYQEAIRRQYRFYSYGDAMFIY
jgi:S-adenosylmethionine:tRNA ribosyltransferase-isomerase